MTPSFKKVKRQQSRGLGHIWEMWNHQIKLHMLYEPDGTRRSLIGCKYVERDGHRCDMSTISVLAKYSELSLKITEEKER